MRLKSVLSAVIILAACRVCAAAVYVDAGSPGPLRNGRSWKSAYLTIGDALAKTRSGDIWVHSGVYRERVTLGRYRNIYGGFVGTETALAQRRADRPATVIDAQRLGRAVDVPTGAICVVDSLVIRNGSADRGGGIRCGTNSTLKMSGCRIEDCWASDMGGGIYFATYTKGEVSGCVIEGNAAPLGGGAVVEYHSYPVLRRSVIAWNHATKSGGGVYCPFHSGARLENCTMAYNAADVSGGAVYAYQGGPVALVGSILAYNSSPLAGGVFGGGVSSATTITRCCLWANDGGDWGGAISAPSASARNIFSDPAFVDAPNGDFRLGAGSPCAGLGALP